METHFSTVCTEATVLTASARMATKMVVVLARRRAKGRSRSSDRFQVIKLTPEWLSSHFPGSWLLTPLISHSSSESLNGLARRKSPSSAA